VGATPCDTGTSYKLVGVPVSDSDKALLSNGVKEVSFPTWSEVCDKTNAQCSADWKKVLGESVGF
jgi:TRAP-type transport system periplasmic protein